MFSWVSRVGSWSPLYSQPGWTCFFSGWTQQASQRVATHTPVKPFSFRRLTLLVKAATTGTSSGVGSSFQVPWNSGSRPTKGGRLGS
jgi:hypothetical protein